MNLFLNQNLTLLRKVKPSFIIASRVEKKKGKKNNKFRKQANYQKKINILQQPKQKPGCISAADVCRVISGNVNVFLIKVLP